MQKFEKSVPLPYFQNKIKLNISMSKHFTFDICQYLILVLLSSSCTFFSPCWEDLTGGSAEVEKMRAPLQVSFAEAEQRETEKCREALEIKTADELFHLNRRPRGVRAKTLRLIWVQRQQGSNSKHSGSRGEMRDRSKRKNEQWRMKKKSQEEKGRDAVKTPLGWQIIQSADGYVGSKACFSPYKRMLHLRLE